MDKLFYVFLVFAIVFLACFLGFLIHMLTTKKKVCYFFNKKDPVYFDKVNKAEKAERPVKKEKPAKEAKPNKNQKTEKNTKQNK